MLRLIKEFVKIPRPFQKLLFVRTPASLAPFSRTPFQQSYSFNLLKAVETVESAYTFNNSTSCEFPPVEI